VRKKKYFERLYVYCERKRPLEGIDVNGMISEGTLNK
jgi:hypothetical protein